MENDHRYTDVKLVGRCMVTDEDVDFVEGKGWCKKDTDEVCGPHDMRSNTHPRGSW